MLREDCRALVGGGEGKGSDGFSDGCVGGRWSRGVWPMADSDEEDEVLSEDEEWMNTEQAKFVRCDTNVGCHYLNGRVRAEEDETVRDIARRYNLEEDKLAWLNQVEHPTITPRSKLVRGTLLLLPLHPTLAQRLPEKAALDKGLELSLPLLASTESHAAQEATSHASSVEMLQGRGRIGGRRATRVSPLVYGSMALRAGARKDLLGARVAVECVNARRLGTVSCYDVTSARYHILLDAHGSSGGLGDVAHEPVVVATPLPSIDVHVVAAMSVSTSRASSPKAEHTLAHNALLASGGSSSAPGEVHVAQAESSDERPPQIKALNTPDQDGMAASSVVSAAQMAALVGMTVTRGFDGVSGKVSTLVPGSDVVIIEWEDGDCEDMHVADMQRQGLL